MSSLRAWVECQHGKDLCNLSRLSRPALGLTEPPAWLDTWRFLPGVVPPCLEADHATGCEWVVYLFPVTNFSLFTVLAPCSDCFSTKRLPSNGTTGEKRLVSPHSNKIRDGGNGRRLATSVDYGRHLCRAALWSVHNLLCCRSLREIYYSYFVIMSNLSNDRSKASSKTIPPHSAI